jgi:hypothetical protein
VTSNVQAITTSPQLSSWQALAGIIDRPRSTLRAVGEQPRYRWLFPLILMIASIVCLSVVTAPYMAQEAAGQMQRQRQAAAVPTEQAGAAAVPTEQAGAAAVPTGQAGAARSQGQAGAAQFQGQMFANPVLRQVIPAATRLLPNLLGWVLLAGALYVIGLVAGGKAGYGQLFAMVSWSWMPYILRDFFQAGYIFATGQLIRLPGLSFLLATGDQARGTANLLYLALGQVDIFLLWNLLLIGLGIAALNRFGRGKTLFIVLIYLLIVIGVALIPVLVGSVAPGRLGSPIRGGGRFILR